MNILFKFYYCFLLAISHITFTFKYVTPILKTHLLYSSVIKLNNRNKNKIRFIGTELKSRRQYYLFNVQKMIGYYNDCSRGLVDERGTIN